MALRVQAMNACIRLVLGWAYVVAFVVVCCFLLVQLGAYNWDGFEAVVFQVITWGIGGVAWYLMVGLVYAFEPLFSLVPGGEVVLLVLCATLVMGAIAGLQLLVLSGVLRVSRWAWRSIRARSTAGGGSASPTGEPRVG